MHGLSSEIAQISRSIPVTQYATALDWFLLLLTGLSSTTMPSSATELVPPRAPHCLPG